MDRNYILDEIRRLASESGGIPPGKRRFLDFTGIRESDWAGKYWIRWSDALVEAGFVPNEMRSAYDREQLLQILAAFIRELGHYPVTNELRMRSSTNQEFPDAKTFSRLGRRAQLASEVATWCAASGEWDDVLAICLAEVEAGERDEPSVEASDDAPLGHVYLMKSGKYYKIGRTNAVGRRLYEMAIQLPEPVSLVHTLTTDDPVGIEAYWHRRFAERRKNGEWFELRREDVAAFKRRRFM